MLNRVGTFFSLVAGFTAALAIGTAPLNAQPTTPAAFERIKALAGKWVGKTSQGVPFTTSFRVTSGGSAVLQMIMEGTDDEMPTVYHMDGDRLMATHYCSAKNQPRMVATASDASESAIRFHFLDVTNLAGPSATHMRDVAFVFLGPDKMRQEWTYRLNGKDSTDTFEAERQR